MTSSYRESLLEALTDPEEAVAYLNAGLEDSLASFLKALKDVTQAHQMTKDAGVQRETLYRSLSEQGNPMLQTLTSVLGAIGLRMRVEAEVAGFALVSEVGGAVSHIKRKDAEHTRLQSPSGGF